jgi:hypothetical protein
MSFDPNLLRGKTALVTGGAQGIGAGIAAELARLAPPSPRPTWARATAACRPACACTPPT